MIVPNEADLGADSILNANHGNTFELIQLF
jgi:hypothetical protein